MCQARARLWDTVIRKGPLTISGKTTVCPVFTRGNGVLEGNAGAHAGAWSLATGVGGHQRHPGDVLACGSRWPLPRLPTPSSRKGEAQNLHRVRGLGSEKITDCSSPCAE